MFGFLEHLIRLILAFSSTRSFIFRCKYIYCFAATSSSEIPDATGTAHGTSEIGTCTCTVNQMLKDIKVVDSNSNKRPRGLCHLRNHLSYSNTVDLCLTAI